MYFILIIIHIIVCIILIATILLQAGRGGGLTEAFGGSDTIQSVLGTQAPIVLKRATEISAVVFLITSLYGDFIEFDRPNLCSTVVSSLSAWLSRKKHNGRRIRIIGGLISNATRTLFNKSFFSSVISF